MSKLTTMAEAIARYVPDGSSVAIGLALEPVIPFAAALLPAIALLFIVSQERGRRVGPALSRPSLKEAAL